MLPFFWPNLSARGFSIRILLLGWMKLDLPTHVSHPTSPGMCLCSRKAYPHPQKYVCKYITMDVCEYKEIPKKNSTHLTAIYWLKTWWTPNSTITGSTKNMCISNEQQCTFKNVNKCLNTNIYSYLETSTGQSYYLCLKVVHFFNTSPYYTPVAA